jgi:hypothetical protein
MNSPTGLVPVHIGQPELVPGAEYSSADRRRGEPPPRVQAGLDWRKHGVEPRWLGMDSSDCPIALEPSIFHNHGAAELDRFLAGASRRGETALGVVVIGRVNDDSPRNPLSQYDASVHLSKTFTSVNGKRLPAGSQPQIAPDLDAADRDLALRLLARPAEAPWWALVLHGAMLHRGDGSGTETHEAEGQLHPILVDALGDPVVAAWTPASGEQRWYIIPDATDWNTVLDWLVQRALPAHIPAALRRVRSPHFIDPDLQTADELAPRQALADLEAQYAQEKQRIEDELRRAETTATPIRYDLLYGTGTELVNAVSTVLVAAGLTTINLDVELEGTKSADLLVTDGTKRYLVEVKAASGPAGEHLVGHLERHLATWPQLRPDPVSGGVLVVNHQHKLHPSERTATVYSRPEFIAALTVPIISTVELFNWWRISDWDSIRAAVLGIELPPPVGASPDSTVRATQLRHDPASAQAPMARAERRRWWRRTRTR